MRGIGAKSVQVSLVVLVGIVLVALGAGLWAGNASAIGAKRMHVLTGQARLLNADGLTVFDTGDPDEQQSFYARGVWFRENETVEHGRLGCLRLQRDVPVTIGWTSVRRPGGGSFGVVAWVDCG
ncbi:hypothetical protein BH10ACT10_BH10ACT10_21930 [soil metagenome]